MGARPIVMLNSLRFGSLDDSRVRYLFSGVVKGIGDYGNCVGIPTVAGEIVFDPAYESNPLVNAMCVGLMHEEDLIRAKAEGVGNPIMAVGARTGRDGIHGASFASEEMSERGDVGVTIDVTKVPTRESGMTPYEILLSESQERMLVVAKKGHEDAVREILAKWDLTAAVIG